MSHVAATLLVFWSYCSLPSLTIQLPSEAVCQRVLRQVDMLLQNLQEYNPPMSCVRRTRFEAEVHAKAGLCSGRMMMGGNP